MHRRLIATLAAAALSVLPAAHAARTASDSAEPGEPAEEPAAAAPALPRIDPAPPPSPSDPVLPLSLRLPTDNRALLEGRPDAFYMGVDRQVDGKPALVWQAGQFGYVRNPVKHREDTVFVRLHEGLDIAPTLRDKRGEPLDLVRSIADGRVVFINPVPGASNYGLHVIVEHNWGYGTFYSLYAHLMRIDATLGATVRCGETLGRLGYTGRGIDRRRAHVHLELNMLLSERFEDWQRKSDPSSANAPNLYHGFNLAGLDVAALFTALANDPTLTLPRFLASQTPYFRVLAPAGPNPPSLLRRYPWLNPNATSPTTPPACPSYEITLTATGLPLSIIPSPQSTPIPIVIATVPFDGRHSWRTSGRLGGTGTAAELTAKGTQYVQLLTGRW